MIGCATVRGRHRACMRPERTGFERMIERYLGGGLELGAVAFW